VEREDKPRKKTINDGRGKKNYLKREKNEGESSGSPLEFIEALRERK